MYSRNVLTLIYHISDLLVKVEVTPWMPSESAKELDMGATLIQRWMPSESAKELDMDATLIQKLGSRY